MQKLRIIVGGFIGLYPTGGVTWDYIQYPLGLKELGHDVYYIEDTFQYSRFQVPGQHWSDATASVAYLKEVMDKFGMSGNWAYRDVASGHCFGLPESTVKELCRTADLFINISASTFMRQEYLTIPVRVFIDSDPMFTQIDYLCDTQSAGTDPYKMKFLLDHHTHFFSFGEQIGKPGCRIPLLGKTWIPTRQPICLTYWNYIDPPAGTAIFSSVMNWAVRPPLQYDNREWGQKDISFQQYYDLPRHVPGIKLEMMITGIPQPRADDLETRGWQIRDPLKKLDNPDKYRDFIIASTAEFSIAKDSYVQSSSGWFSCRSAAYLASGRPVVAQDTGWSACLPSGSGLLAFTGLESAANAIRSVAGDIPGHSRAAREIALQYFDSRIILRELIGKI